MLASASKSQSSSYIDSWLAGGRQASSMIGVDGIGFGGGVTDPSRVGVFGGWRLMLGPVMEADSLKMWVKLEERGFGSFFAGKLGNGAVFRLGDSTLSLFTRAWPLAATFAFWLSPSRPKWSVPADVDLRGDGLGETLMLTWHVPVGLDVVGRLLRDVDAGDGAVVCDVRRGTFELADRCDAVFGGVACEQSGVMSKSLGVRPSSRAFIIASSSASDGPTLGRFATRSLMSGNGQERCNRSNCLLVLIGGG